MVRLPQRLPKMATVTLNPKVLALRWTFLPILTFQSHPQPPQFTFQLPQNQHFPPEEEISDPDDLMDFNEADMESSDSLSSLPDDLALLEPVDAFHLPLPIEILVDEYFDFELPWFGLW